MTKYYIKTINGNCYWVFANREKAIQQVATLCNCPNWVIAEMFNRDEKDCLPFGHKLACIKTDTLQIEIDVII